MSNFNIIWQITTIAFKSCLLIIVSLMTAQVFSCPFYPLQKYYESKFNHVFLSSKIAFARFEPRVMQICCSPFNVHFIFLAQPVLTIHLSSILPCCVYCTCKSIYAVTLTIHINDMNAS